MVASTSKHRKHDYKRAKKTLIFPDLRRTRYPRGVFLMDYEANGGEDESGVLTVGKTATSKLMAVVVMVSVMGILQSGI